MQCHGTIFLVDFSHAYQLIVSMIYLGLELKKNMPCSLIRKMFLFCSVKVTGDRGNSRDFPLTLGYHDTVFLAVKLQIIYIDTGADVDDTTVYNHFVPIYVISSISKLSEHDHWSLISATRGWPVKTSVTALHQCYLIPHWCHVQLQGGGVTHP